MFKTLVTCCCPAEEDIYSDERSHLIRNGGPYVGNRWSGAYGSTGSGSGREQRNGDIDGTPADDEQAILARILQKTANDVIDISANDVHTVEPREYMERARKYNQQLSNQITATNLQQTGTVSTPTVRLGYCLLTDSTLTASGGATFAAVDRSLSTSPVNPDDLFMIRQVCSEISDVVDEIHVDHKEDLVVQFVPS